MPKRDRTPKITTILLGTPSVNSRNFSGTKGMGLTPWFGVWQGPDQLI